jgi:hypothetical protein
MTPEQRESEYNRLSELYATGEDLTPEEKIWYRDEILSRWEQAKIQNDHFKDYEMSLRKMLVEIAGDPEIAKGTEYVPLYNGYKLKIDKKVTYGLVKNDNKELDYAKIDATIAQLKAAGPDGENIADQLIKMKPELSTSLYNTIPDSYRTIASNMVVSTVGAPTVSILEPKAKK